MQEHLERTKTEKSCCGKCNSCSAPHTIHYFTPRSKPRLETVPPHKTTFGQSLCCWFHYFEKKNKRNQCDSCYRDGPDNYDYSNINESQLTQSLALRPKSQSHKMHTKRNASLDLDLHIHSAPTTNSRKHVSVVSLTIHPAF